MDQGDLAFCLLQWNRWRTKPRAPRKVSRNTALGGDYRIVFDCQVANDADLACHFDVFADPCAAGNPRLRGDDGIFSNGHVVRDLDEIVDFDSVLNPSSTKPGPVDRRVRADFNVVINLNDPDLRDFLISAFDRFKSETVGADDSSAVNDYARADFRSFTNRHVWINKARLSDCTFVADVTSGADQGFVSNPCSCFNDGMRLDGNAIPKFRAGINNGRWMYPRLEYNRLRREF